MGKHASRPGQPPLIPALPVVVVTGVSSGIGFDIAQHLASVGYFVFGSVRNQAAKIDVQNRISANFSALVFDVTDRDSIEGCVPEVEKKLDGRCLHGLVNNAGIVEPGPLQLLEDERFEQVIKVNLLGTRNAINAFLPCIGAEGDGQRSGRPGKIVNIGSLSGIINTPINGAYCVSKHAQESLGEVYRRELRPFGIDVVSIRPGPIESLLWDKNIGSMERFAQSRYARMVERADEVMRAAQDDALPASAVSIRIQRILSSRKSSTSYVITKNSIRAQILAHLIPARWMDRLLASRLS